MARETLGYSRLEWVCPNCGGKNPGPQKTCSTCGGPQPENVQFQAPEKEELVDDSEKQKAQAGADIHCPYCGTRNPGNAEICSQCGGDLKSGAVRASGQVLGAFQNKTPAEIKCPACGSANPANAVRCQNCGAQLVSAAKAPAESFSPQKKSSPWLFIILGIIALALAFGCFWLVSGLTKKTDMTATVQSVGWERSITIEKYGPVSKSDWKEEIPAGATLGSCEWREHHTQSEPAPNAEKVCGTPYQVDKGNGYAEVVQDCEYKVEQEYCKYEVNEWSKADEAVLSGSDLNPAWPNPAISDSNMRLGDRSENYTINLSADGKLYTYHPDSAEFLQFTENSQWKIVVNGFDQIVSVDPK